MYHCSQKKKNVHKTSMASTKLKDLKKYRYDYINFSGHFWNTTATKMAQWVRVNLGYGQVVRGFPFCVSNTQLLVFFFYKLLLYLRYKNTFTDKEIFKKKRLYYHFYFLLILLLDSTCRYLPISNQKKGMYMVLQLICSLCSRYMAFY